MFSCGRSIRRAVFFTALLGGALACGSAKLAAPSYVAHPPEALQPVPYPPPAAHVENVPPRPSDDVVWIDGEWIWQTRRWTWRRGRWVKPIPGARYSPWTSVRDENGNLFVAAGTWRGSRGEAIAEPGLPPISDEAPPFGHRDAGPELDATTGLDPSPDPDAGASADRPDGAPDRLLLEPRAPVAPYR